MKELTRIYSPVRLTWLKAALAAEGIEVVVLDSYTSDIYGEVIAIPRRVMVDDRDYARASRILADGRDIGIDV